MPKIINAYGSDDSLSSALSGLASSFLGNNVQQELYRQKAKGLYRENENIPLLADAVAGNDPAATARFGILSGVDPKVTGGYRQYYGVQKFGPGSAEATRDTMSVPGANYSNTVQGEREAQANKVGIENLRTQRLFDAERFKVDNTPELVQTPEGPRIARRSEAFGQTPVLSHTQAQGTVVQQDLPSMTPEQRAIVGGYAPKNPSAIYSYRSPDGREGTTITGTTDAHTGEPLPPGTKAIKLEGPNAEGLTGNNAVDRQLLDARNNRDRAVMMIDRLNTALSQPNADQSVGFLGTLARTFNDVRSQSEATVRLLGGELASQAFSKPENRAAVDGVMTTLFGDPRITTKAQQLGISSAVIRSQVQDLAYMIAKTQDPSGRVSIDDIHRASDTVAGMIMDPSSSRAVLADLKQRINDSHDIVERNTRSMYPGVNRGAAPAAPVAPSQPAAEKWERVNGVLQRVQ